MERYREFRPTGFDPAGLGGERHGISDFEVLYSQTRDSDYLTQSNFAVALAQLGGESDSVQVHRFGHWACGWFELILVDPKDEDKYREAEEIEGSLSEYPILDEDDYSQRIDVAAGECWERESVAERVRIIQRYGQHYGEHVSVFAARRDELPCGLDVTEWMEAC
jgi:hypothetical protein